MSDSRITERLTLTVEEAADAIGIGRTLAYEAAKRGEIPVVRIGRRLLVPRAALDSLLTGESCIHLDAEQTPRSHEV